jgi:hypothetical protein
MTLLTKNNLNLHAKYLVKRFACICLLGIAGVYAGYAQTQPTPQYKVRWTDLTGVTLSNQMLVRVAPGERDWVNGANSSNVLPSYTDGYFEFQILNAGSTYMIGFSVDNVINRNVTQSFLVVAGGTLQNYELSAQSMGTYQAGDYLKLSREGNTVKYYKNNVVLKTTTVDPSLELSIKAIIRDYNNIVPVVSTNIQPRLFVTGNVVGAGGIGKNGTISLSVQGGKSPYTYLWSTGEQTSSITQPVGQYNVTVTDADNISLTKTFYLYYKTNFVDVAGVTASNGQLTKTSTTAGWNAGGIVSNFIPASANEWIEFPASFGNYYAVGFTISNSYTLTGIDNGIIVNPTDGKYYKTVAGVNTAIGYWRSGDVFRIARNGTTIYYYKNGLVVGSSATSKYSSENKFKVLVYAPRCLPNWCFLWTLRARIQETQVLFL